MISQEAYLVVENTRLFLVFYKIFYTQKYIRSLMNYEVAILALQNINMTVMKNKHTMFFFYIIPSLY